MFGGDERYERRLVAPYGAALEWTVPPHPDLFAPPPAVHDWYENLVGFGRRFVARTGSGGGARQQRSYFALKLPHGWWLVGSDVQLASDLDEPHVEFLRAVARRMAAADRVILCTAEPHWVYEPERTHPRKPRGTTSDSSRPRCWGAASAYLAGDQPHYRRHATRDDGVQKITAGGGEVFLHPTHGWRRGELAGSLRLRCAFPTERVSWWLGVRNALFPLRNPRFGLVSGIVSVLLYLAITGSLGMGREAPPPWRDILVRIPFDLGATLVAASV